MSKADVLAAFDDNLDDPGSEKSGEYLHEHVLESARRALAAGDRTGLVDAVRVREWLAMRRLKTDVHAGGALWPDYVRKIDEPLAALPHDS